MSETTLKKYRLSIARMVFTETEVFAVDHLVAAELARDMEGAAMKFQTGPFVHRIEQNVPVPGRPGEYAWEEVKRC